MKFAYLGLFLFCYLFVEGATGQANGTTISMFVPTYEWQTVLQNQQLPPGLHIRQNLQTGLTEAKLLNSDNANYEPDHSVVLVKSVEQPEIGFKAEGSPVQQMPQLSHAPEDSQRKGFRNTTWKFRSYELLKSEFKTLFDSIRTDLEIINDLFKDLAQVDQNPEQVPFILEQLSYLLHQYDNGRHFAENNGFALLQKFIASPNETLQLSALSVFSAAIQGNSAVKVAALQAGVLDTAYKILESKASSGIQSSKILSAALTTISALLLDFPSAQRYFFAEPTTYKPGLSGFTLLSTLYDRHSENTGDTVLLRIKILRLISDLVLEQSSAKSRSLENSNKADSELWRLYSSINFSDLLVRYGWCERLQHSVLYWLPPGVAEDQLDTISNHGVRQDILTCLSNVYPICAQSIRPCPNMRRILKGLEDEYFVRSRTEDNEQNCYFTDLYNVIVKIREMMDSVPGRVTLDEL